MAEKLRDPVGKAAILSRLKRLESGNFGDARAAGDGVAELRIHVGPGYRVYVWEHEAKLIVVLGAGTKNGQQADINSAKAKAAELAGRKKR